MAWICKTHHKCLVLPTAILFHFLLASWCFVGKSIQKSTNLAKTLSWLSWNTTTYPILIYIWWKYSYFYFLFYFFFIYIIIVSIITKYCSRILLEKNRKSLVALFIWVNKRPKKYILFLIKILYSNYIYYFLMLSTYTIWVLCKTYNMMHNMCWDSLVYLDFYLRLFWLYSS